MLDLNYLEQSEPGINWFKIGLTEGREYCGTMIIYRERVPQSMLPKTNTETWPTQRQCTRGRGHTGPHVSGRVIKNILANTPPIYWSDTIPAIEIGDIDYAAYELCRRCTNG